MQLNLYQHQSECLAFMRKLPRAFNLGEYGTGKTYPSIARMRDLSPREHWLVVATRGMVPTWLDRLRTYGEPWWRIAALTGTRKERWAEFCQPHHVAVINYEGLQIFGDRLLGHYGGCVFDEIHRAKEPSTKLSRAVAALSANARYVYGLTGSPVLEHPMDAYGVVRAINPQLFGPDYEKWVHRYFSYERGVTDDGRPAYPTWEPKPGTMVMLNALFQNIGIRHTRAELPFDWPEEVHCPPVMVDLEPAVRREYDRMEQEYHAYIRHGTVRAGEIWVRLRKLCQLACGWIYGPGKKPVFVGGSGKAEALAALLEETRGTGPMVVWGVHRPDMGIAEQTFRRMGLRVGVIHGQTSAEAAEGYRHALNDGLIDGLVAHPRTLGEGVDLNVPYSTRFSWGWSHLEWSQPMGRFVRMNSRLRRVFYTNLIARNTVDEDMVASIEAKCSYLNHVVEKRSLRFGDRRPMKHRRAPAG